jgi:hypothetical protein
MKKSIIDINILDHYIKDFINQNGKTPGLRDLYRHKGCPYSKVTILKEYENLDNLYKILGYDRKAIGYDNITDSQLLEELITAIYKYRTTDRDELKKRGIKDRAVYERRFGSWSDALKLAGFNNTQRVLMTYFEGYKGQEPIQFLKNSIGQNGDFTDKQKDMINKGKHIRRYKDFLGKDTLFAIACGKEPDIIRGIKSKYVSDDGHECDSKEERVVDNFLYENGYQHSVHINYPSSKMICDFKVKDLYVEYAGLVNCGDSRQKKYIEKLEKKKQYALENGLKLYILYDTKKESLKQLRAALDGNIY